MAEKGRLDWQRETDCKRSKAETAMARYKRILGDHLHARKLPGQQAEAAYRRRYPQPHDRCRTPGFRPRRITDQNG